MEAALILAIIQALLKYGPNAVIAISEAIQRDGADNITPEDIEKLFIHREPEDYFSSGGE